MPLINKNITVLELIEILEEYDKDPDSPVYIEQFVKFIRDKYTVK